LTQRGFALRSFCHEHAAQISDRDSADSARASGCSSEVHGRESLDARTIGFVGSQLARIGEWVAERRSSSGSVNHAYLCTVA
jgi:hypothetical protein